MKIDHLGIAVCSLEKSLEFYHRRLGLPMEETEEVPDQKVRVALLPVGDSRIELLEATSDDSPISKFISRRGEGLHHVCLEVEDIETLVKQLKASGVRLVDEVPREGAGGHKIAFLHPAGSHGVLIELVEKSDAKAGKHGS